MIILEGPDGSGKTTLAEAIAEHFHLEYRRGPGIDSEKGVTPDRHVWWQEQMVPGVGDDGVYDRCWWISEPIYQMAQPGKLIVTSPYQEEDGIRKLWVEAPLIIFCLPPWEVTLSNINQKPRLEGVYDTVLEKVWWLYHIFYAMWSEMIAPHCYAHDYTKPHSRDRALSAVQNYLDATRRH